MASVPSLDKDLRQLRLDKYTPKAAKEVRDWIEEILGERIQDGDLLAALKDGLVLCRLVNKAITPGVKAKPSSMPFVQRENISHFVRACQLPPLSLPDHDIFMTDDLYEAKDPAQVLQCITAFSRRAHAVNSTSIPRAIGKTRPTVSNSPQINPVKSPYGRTPLESLSRDRTGSNASDTPPLWNSLAKGSYAAGRISPTKGLDSKSSPGNVSSWSRKGDQGNTAPAWNIHQYGYMGGASQGNQGVSFGAPRQITAAIPSVPNMADKERRRKEAEAEEERQHKEAEEAERKRRLEAEAEAQAEEERARIAEEEKWEQETRKAKQKEQELEREQNLERERERDQKLAREREREETAAKAEAEADRRRWDEEQRSWKGEEERKLEVRRPGQQSQRIVSDPRLTGQFLSQYQAGQPKLVHNGAPPPAQNNSETDRIKELERQLEEAKRREQQHQLDMEEEKRRNLPAAPIISSSNYSASPPGKDSLPVVGSIGSLEDDWQESERQYLQQEHQSYADSTQDHLSNSKIPTKFSNAPDPSAHIQVEKATSRPLPSPRPLPDPSAYTPTSNRTDRYLSSNPAPEAQQPISHRPQDYSSTTEVDLENQRRKESQAKTRAGGWASKSLLEREMERERERQKEWEEGQKNTASAARNKQEGAGPGQTWDVHQYGFMGGDSQNRGGPGLGVGGARRQIIGPRPPP